MFSMNFIKIHDFNFYFVLRISICVWNNCHISQIICSYKWIIILNFFFLAVEWVFNKNIILIIFNYNQWNSKDKGVFRLFPISMSSPTRNFSLLETTLTPKTQVAPYTASSSTIRVLIATTKPTKKLNIVTIFAKM